MMKGTMLFLTACLLVAGCGQRKTASSPLAAPDLVEREFVLVVHDHAGKPIAGARIEVGPLARYNASYDTDADGRAKFKAYTGGRPIAIYADGYVPFRCNVNDLKADDENEIVMKGSSNKAIDGD